MKYLRLYIIGLSMGVADLIPGVSGGTIAFISGIYQELLKAIKAFDFQMLANAFKFKFDRVIKDIPFSFLIPLFLGIFSAVLLGSKIIKGLLVSSPSYVFTFFAGLILASAYVVVKKENFNRVQFLIYILLSILIYITFEAFRAGVAISHAPLCLFVSGMIAISAMILPGISGSFILLILGQYEFILDAVNKRDFYSLFFVAFGCGIGLFISVRIVSFLLKNYKKATVLFLASLMTGSMQVILLRIKEGLVLDKAFCIMCYGLLFILGIVFILGFERFTSSKD